MSERFELLRKLGEDDWTEVHRAADRHLGRAVVLRRLKPEVAGDERLSRKLLREARALARVRSPRVLGLFEAGEDSEGAFLALEPTSGASLRDRLDEEGPLSVEAAVALGVDLCEALSAVHRAGLVHRNVHPEHVGFDSEGRAVLSGFELAAQAPGTDDDADLTVGQTSFCPAGGEERPYYSPEERWGGALEASSDLFALGALLVAALTWKRGRSPALSGRSRSLDRAVLDRLRPDLPAALRDALQSAMAKDIERRPASAADLSRALRVEEPSSPSAPDLFGSATATPPRRRGLLVGGGAAALLVLVGVLVFVIAPGGGGPGESADDGSRETASGARGLETEPRSAGAGFDVGYAASHAVVVGIDRYADEGWPALEGAQADARAIRDVLVESEGFPAENVTLLLGEKATRRAILSELRNRLPRQTGADDRVVFFFAGHGQQQQAPGRGRGEQVGYLVPHDGPKDDPSLYLSHADITGATDLMRAKHVLLLLDCCYAGWATRGAPGRAVFESATRARARQILTAGRPGELVQDRLPGGSPHSPFTHFLLEALRDPASGAEGCLTATELGTLVRRRVVEATEGRQNPVFLTLEGAGDFVFGGE